MLALVLAIAPLAGIPRPPQAPASLPPVVSTAWLAEQLGDRRLVIFQIGDQGSRPLYDEGHIPGSQFLNPNQELSAPRREGALLLELPDPARLDSVLEAKGVGDDSRVILVAARQYHTPTTRAYLTLVWAGFEGRVAILDGGLEAWKGEGRPVSQEVPAPAPGQVTIRPRAGIVVDAEYVKGRLEDRGTAIVDARDTSFYNGRETRQARSGRIPGAVSIPFVSIVDSAGKFKSPEALRALFAGAGVAPGSRVVTYCHIGQQATLVWFAARLVGLDAAMYDGSFQDWAARSELPVVSPPRGAPQ